MSFPSSLAQLGHKVYTGVLDLVYPPLCYLCARLLGVDEACLCGDCRHALVADPRVSCPRCAETIGAFTADPQGCNKCRDRDYAFAAAYRLGPYADRLRQAALVIKHAAGQDLGAVLGEVLAAELEAKLRAEAIDLVIPVPLHWLRRLQRGCNQAEALARPLARRLGVPYRPGWLRRRRYTSHQVGQAVTARRENMRGAFVARQRPGLHGKTVLLVDDVMTTGSTCSEAARALRRAGSGRVVVAILARSET